MKVLVFEYALESNEDFRSKYKHNEIYECEHYNEILNYAVDCNLYAAAKKHITNKQYDYLIIVDTVMFRQR